MPDRVGRRVPDADVSGVVRATDVGGRVGGLRQMNKHRTSAKETGKTKNGDYIVRVRILSIIVAMICISSKTPARLLGCRSCKRHWAPEMPEQRQTNGRCFRCERRKRLGVLRTKQL